MNVAETSKQPYLVIQRVYDHSNQDLNQTNGNQAPTLIVRNFFITPLLDFNIIVF